MDDVLFGFAKRLKEYTITDGSGVGLDYTFTNVRVVIDPVPYFPRHEEEVTVSMVSAPTWVTEGLARATVKCAFYQQCALDEQGNHEYALTGNPDGKFGLMKRVDQMIEILHHSYLTGYMVTPLVEAAELVATNRPQLVQVGSSNWRYASADFRVGYTNTTPHSNLTAVGAVDRGA